MGQYDTRDENFSCAEDHMGGSLFMVDKVYKKKDNADLMKKLTAGSFNSVSGEFVMNKVSVNMNSKKLSVADVNKELREIVNLDTVYPRLDMIKDTLINGDDKTKRTRIE